VNYGELLAKLGNAKPELPVVVELDGETYELTDAELEVEVEIHEDRDPADDGALQESHRIVGVRLIV
jgi:hypothetical protein